jgi:Peptidase M76 family
VRTVISRAKQFCKQTQLPDADTVVRIYSYFHRCKDLARSEVRAAREAECHYNTATATADSTTAQWWFAHSWRDCVRQKAIRSTSQMCPSTAAQCVDAVFNEAMTDTVPLHTQPVQGVYSDTLKSIKQWWGSSGSANSSSSVSTNSSSSSADTSVNSDTNSSSNAAGASRHSSVNSQTAKSSSSSRSSSRRDTNPP